MMSAKDDLIVLGVVGVGLLGGVYLVTKGVGDLVPDVGKWIDDVLKNLPTFKLPDLTKPDEPIIDPMGALQEWYMDAVDQINDLNKQIGDLKNDAQNTIKTGGGAVMTVSPLITNLGSNLDDMIDKSIAAKDVITKTIADAGGVVSSGTEEAKKIIDAAKDIIAWQVPGWMPVGEI